MASGRSYVSLVVSTEPDPSPGSTEQHVWILGVAPGTLRPGWRRRQPVWRKTLAAGGAALLVSACSRTSSTAPSPTATPEVVAVTTRTVVPSDTSSRIQPTIGDHLVSIGTVSRRTGRLFVFYPGTGARPDQYAHLVRRAAELGYHAIGLAYDNFDSINFAVCPGQAASCSEQARLEILLGVESGYTPPDVDEDNAAFSRLVQLLRHLDSRYPTEGWGAYLDGADTPAWDRISFGGHSQGGGHAAMTARLYRVDRALLFDATEPASWTSTAFATPPERFFGFAHAREPIFAPITASWQTIGLPGALTSVDSGSTPFGGSHRLSTSVASCRGDSANAGYYHNCPVVDEYVPFAADGTTPLFQPVWDHLLTSPLP